MSDICGFCGEYTSVDVVASYVGNASPSDPIRLCPGHRWEDMRPDQRREFAELYSSLPYRTPTHDWLELTLTPLACTILCECISKITHEEIAAKSNSHEEYVEACKDIEEIQSRLKTLFAQEEDI